MSQCSPWPQPSPSWRNSHFICLPFLWFSFELIPSFLSSLCSDICSTSKIIDLVLWRFMAVMTKPRLSFFPLLFINFFFPLPIFVSNRDILPNKCRKQDGNTVYNFWCFSFEGSCLWRGAQRSIPPFKNPQEIQYFPLFLGRIRPRK